MNPSDNLTKLKNKLGDLGINYELIHHLPITTVEEGLKELGIEAADGVSTLIMNADGKYIELVRRDDKKISLKKVKKLLHIKNLQFASRNMVKELTNCDIGYVSLFNEKLETYLDQSILERHIVYGGSGSPEHDLKITPQSLVKLTSAQIVDISE